MNSERFTVEAGPSMYMSGARDWHIRRSGKPSVLATFAAHSGVACVIRDLLNEDDTADELDTLADDEL